MYHTLYPILLLIPHAPCNRTSHAHIISQLSFDDEDPIHCLRAILYSSISHLNTTSPPLPPFRALQSGSLSPVRSCPSTSSSACPVHSRRSRHNRQRSTRREEDKEDIRHREIRRIRSRRSHPRMRARSTRLASAREACPFARRLLQRGDPQTSVPRPSVRKGSMRERGRRTHRVGSTVGIPV